MAALVAGAGALLPPLGIALAAVTAIAGALYLSRDAQFEVNGQAHKMSDVYRGIWEEIKSGFVGMWDGIVAAAKSIWGVYVSGWKLEWQGIVDFVGLLPWGDKIKAALERDWDGIKNWVKRQFADLAKEGEQARLADMTNDQAAKELGLTPEQRRMLVDVPGIDTPANNPLNNIPGSQQSAEQYPGQQSAEQYPGPSQAQCGHGRCPHHRIRECRRDPRGTRSSAAKSRDGQKRGRGRPNRPEELARVKAAQEGLQILAKLKKELATPTQLAEASGYLEQIKQSDLQEKNAAFYAQTTLELRGQIKAFQEYNQAAEQGPAALAAFTAMQQLENKLSKEGSTLSAEHKNALRELAQEEYNVATAAKAHADAVRQMTESSNAVSAIQQEVVAARQGADAVRALAAAEQARQFMTSHNLPTSGTDFDAMTRDNEEKMHWMEIQKTANEVLKEFNPGLELENKLKSIGDAWKAGAINVQEYNLAVDQAQIHYEEAMDKMLMSTRNMVNGAKAAFDEWGRSATDAAQNAKKVVDDMMNGLTDDITKAMEGQHVKFKKIWEQMEDDIVKGFVKQEITGPMAKELGKIIPGLGGTKPPSGTLSDPMYVSVVGASGTVLDPSGSSAGTADGSGGSGIGGILGNLLGPLGKWLNRNTPQSQAQRAAQQRASSGVPTLGEDNLNDLTNSVQPTTAPFYGSLGMPPWSPPPIPGMNENWNMFGSTNSSPFNGSGPLSELRQFRHRYERDHVLVHAGRHSSHFRLPASRAGSLSILAAGRLHFVPEYVEFAK